MTTTRAACPGLQLLALWLLIRPVTVGAFVTIPQASKHGYSTVSLFAVDYAKTAPNKPRTRKEMWSAMHKRILQYRRTHGDCLVPYGYKEYPKLAFWVQKQRQNYRLRCLSDDRTAKLDAIGFVWSVHNMVTFDAVLERLVEYKNQHGDCLVPRGYDEDPKLGAWVRKQRQNYRLQCLSDDHITKLENIGFVWSVRNMVTFDAVLDRLVEYKNQHGDCVVPRGYDADPKLAKWVRTQRQYYRRQCLSDDRTAKLDAIAFVWSLQKR